MCVLHLDYTVRWYTNLIRLMQIHTYIYIIKVCKKWLWSGCVSFTWAGAAWVLGCFIWLVMAVKVSITLPWTLDEAASISTAELTGSTGWIFCKWETAQHWKRVKNCLLLNVTGRRRALPRSTHHTLATHRSHRCSLCHGHTQNVWGCTVGSGTWTHCCCTYRWTLRYKHIWWVIRDAV